MLKESPIRFQIEYQCPQCGAPATLEETDRLFHCEYCRVKSYLQAEQFRYVLPHQAPKDKQLLYVPYWRFKGMRFTCLADRMEHRLIDVSLRAIDGEAFPRSVGIRSQTQKLRFASPEMKGRFLTPTIPNGAMMDIIDKRFATLTNPIVHQADIGDSLSIIYSPFYVGTSLMDAILNQPVNNSLSNGFDASSYAGDRLDWNMRFLPILCPHCGWDLTGKRDSLVLSCENCASVYKPDDRGFSKFTTVHIAGQGEPLRYLPFWCIKADISGLTLKAYSDLVREANLPKTVKPGDSDSAFYFWALAFKVRPQFFIKLSQTMTLAQPQGTFFPGIPKADLHPVNLPLKEGLESLKLTLSGIIKPRHKIMNRLPGIKIKPTNVVLVYLPFIEKHHDLIQPEMNVAINKNMLAHARNL
jgi:DNA-directed RNA polymerase subunit RPC12/RpoP